MECVKRTGTAEFTRWDVSATSFKELVSMGGGLEWEPGPMGSGSFYVLAASGSMELVSPGDYVVAEEDGTVKVMSEKEFKRDYMVMESPERKPKRLWKQGEACEEEGCEGILLFDWGTLSSRHEPELPPMVYCPVCGWSTSKIEFPDIEAPGVSSDPPEDSLEQLWD